MRLLATVMLAAVAAAAQAGADPIAECRVAHGGDPVAHVACLEDALRARMPSSRRQPSPAVPAVAPVAAPAPTGATPAAAASAEVGPAAAPTGLGAEQVKARERPLDAPPETVEVRIVGSGYNSEGLGTFRMADGQVWRETTPAPKRYKLKPSQEYAARVETSKLGGYRLYVEGKTWMYKVERLK